MLSAEARQAGTPALPGAIFTVSGRRSRHKHLLLKPPTKSHEEREGKEKIFAQLRVASWVVLVTSGLEATWSESPACWWIPEPSSGNPQARLALRRQPHCPRRARQRRDRS